MKYCNHKKSNNLKNPKNSFVFTGFFIVLYALTASSALCQSHVQGSLIPHQGEAQSSATKFKVVGVETHGNITAVQKDIHKVVQNTIGTEVGLAEIKSLITRLSSIYALTGDARVSVPLQNIQNGIIPVTLGTGVSTKTATAEIATPPATEASATIAPVVTATATEEITPVTYQTAIEPVEEPSTTVAPAAEVSPTFVSKSVIKLKDTPTAIVKKTKKEVKAAPVSKKVKPQKPNYAERTSGLEDKLKAARHNKAMKEAKRNIFLLKTPPQKKTPKVVKPVAVQKVEPTKPKYIKLNVVPKPRVDAKLGLPKPRPMFPKQKKYVEPEVNTGKMRINRGL